uniref:Pre-mRNA-splicing factor RBM22 n=1 Tax=Panagrellus redivivus TaxID=6233 RepID=A0A7E4ZV46_PANRE
MSKDSLYNRKHWEDSEFPILCNTCLGPNPYIKMTKNKYGDECKVCNRPFTSYRWQPGRGARHKKTEVCQTCAKMKNVCQTCLLDLEYGLPVQVRDQALAVKEQFPTQGANRDFFIQNAERAMANTDGTTPYGELALIPNSGNNEILKKLAATRSREPYYARNAPHICSFFVKGECKRGDECPYRHEAPKAFDEKLSQQNIKDRYYGVNDPVAEKLTARAKAAPKLVTPADQTITTLYVGNIACGDELKVNEEDLRNHFYQYGEIRQIHIHKNQCAFIDFLTREGAELAAERSFGQTNINGQKLTIRWGRPQSQSTRFEGVEERRVYQQVPNLPGSLPLPHLNEAGGSSSAPYKRHAPPSADEPSSSKARVVIPHLDEPSSSSSSSIDAGKVYYPSQDPNRLGTRAPL